MNISTGGPHILLFERDQQLTGLLISEFQLAGYECHTARTAVEVFDAIARQPIRLVLVNLAQAAAARREFWVALDTQRRGRGVQVMTFHCSNIANYGPKDPDEHATTMVDLEVDGMMGIMNLVDGVRARVPVGITSATLNQAQRISRSTGQANSGSNLNTNFASGTSVPRSPLSNENQPAPIGSNYASQGSSLSPNGEPGFMRGETQARMPYVGQMTNTTGNVSSQPSYMSGSNTGSNPQQAAYSQNASMGNIPTQQQPYTQNISANNMSFQQPSYTQNTNAASNPPAQSPPYAQNTSNTSNIPAQPSSYVQNMGTNNNAPAQPSYTEKIRAVLYPNQRAWVPQGTTTQTSTSERASYDGQMTAPPPQPAPTTNDPTGPTALQRLANGQTGSDTPWESGLAQLSRMVQERNTFLENTNNTPAYPSPTPLQERNNAFLENAVNNTPIYPSPTLPQTRNNTFENTNNTPAYPSPITGAAQEPSFPPTMNKNFGQFSPALSPTAYSTQGVTQINPSPENLSTRTLRASPIQDLPGERSTGNLSSSESGKRPDVLSRTNYGQQPTNSHPSLASISAATQPEREKEGIQERAERAVSSESQTGIPSINIVQEGAPYSTRGRTAPFQAPIKSGNEMGKPIKARSAPEQPAQIQAEVISETAPPAQGKSISERAQPGIQDRTSVTESGILRGTRGATPTHHDERIQVSEQETPMQTSPEINDYSDYKEVENNKRLLEIEKAQAEIKVALGQHASFDTSNTPSNALILDIMQSLPPMPAPLQQQIQPQALNGRATRSLGSVLLEGHLVPQSRLEVAQNVQRMLRGVDLNYQLGEILLMFKLLTPDQLLAASLVSYGMITTTQISALGRIRQELHAIGLEYDLENLLIMFRILTPEQLREVRASWQ